MKHFEDLPERLAALLREKGWTQKDLHLRSDVAASQISDYLNPKKGNYPTLATLSRLLDALGASREDLFAITEEVEPEEATVDKRIDSLEEQYSYIETQLSALRLEVDRRFRAIEEREEADTREHGIRSR